MPKPTHNSMTLDEFEALELQRTRAFFARWRSMHQQDPKRFPLVMLGERMSPLTKWEQHFEAFQEDTSRPWCS